MKRVNVHIDQLVLEGIDAQGQQDFAAGIQQGLQELLSNHDAIKTLGNMGNIKQLNIDSTAATLPVGFRGQGTMTAKSIVNGLNKPTSSQK